MNNLRLYVLSLLAFVLMAAVLSAVASANTSKEIVCSIEESPWCLTPRFETTLAPLAGATVPKIATPDWMGQDDGSAIYTVKYDVRTRGTVTSDLNEFKRVAAQTFSDARGWASLGIRFEETANQETDFTLWLSEASSLTTFSPTGCDSTYSCNVGRDVIINQDRWEQATPSWNTAGGSLAAYRQMVINHETGHWLGHGHRYCGEDGEDAPIMQQQSMNMQGCEPNAWPLSQERYAPTLGIRS